MRDGWFKLASGREVMLKQFHIQVSTLGFLAGSPERIYTEVLRRLPVEVSKRYGDTGLLLHEPATGPLPTYTFFADLQSYQSVQPGADCSCLVICWFGDSLPENVQNVVASQLETLDWDKYAKDILL